MKNLFKVMLAALWPTIVAFAGAAQAESLNRDTINQVNAIANEELPAAQVTSITQLSDVKPTDWAYQALQSLVERYGCIVGYPDRTYRGSRALTRYEFAAGLNACLDKVIEFAASKEDLDTLKKLMEEFQAELATLRGRVDSLEARVTELEATQFSTTTKLQGEVILSLDRAFGPSGLDTGTSFSQRVSLNLNTSFTGKDLLKTRLRSNSITSPGLRDFNGGVPGSGIISPAAALDYDNATNAPNANFFLDTLLYTFPVGDVKFTVGTSNLQVEDILSTTGTFYAPYISYFFSTPIPGIYGDADTTNSAGAGFNWQLSKNFNFGAAYINQNGPTTGGNLASDPTSGVFGADSQTTAQLAFKNDSGTFIGALAYAYRKGPDLATDLSFLPSQFGGVNFGTLLVLWLGLGAPVHHQRSYGISFGNGFGANNTVQSWTVGFTFPNLFADGNEFGFAVGQAPYVISDSRGAAFQDSGNFAFEVYYKLQVTDNISITPALYAITNAGGGLSFPDSANGDFIVPVIKTVFTF
uniref:SomB n=1 Tax=Synechococcus sp. (strain ATCC 27144 / PCC 6301 / SAUG 1402/1) TaxID=269084 RepID=O86993_SYNP6|nr:SomB [Synechococcus elongatus PCC 6301]